MTGHDVIADSAAGGGLARREALRLTGALGLAAAGIVATCDHALAADADAAVHATGPRHRVRDPRVYTFRIGEMKIVALYDGFSDLPTRLYAATAPEGVPEAMLAARGLSPDIVRNPSIPILIDTGSDLVLLDAGWGAATAPFAEDRLTGGEVVRNLAAAGYRPEDVSHVVVSHASADHIGGLVDERGRRVFRRARTVFMRREWEFWSREEPTPQLNALTRDWFLTYTRRIFPVVAPTVQLLDRDTELVPGVRVISAPGHTPGHLGLLVSSGDERLLHLSDAVGHYVLSLENPEWFFGADVDPELAVATRRRLLDMASEPGTLAMAYHFPFPSLGRVAKTDEDSYAWSLVEPGHPVRTRRR